MNKIFIIIIACLLVNSLVLAETGLPPDPQQVIKGKVLYEKHCEVCHQKDGVGENEVPWSIRAPGFIPAMPLNDTSHAWHHGDEQLVKMILEGTRAGGRMPAWKNILTEDEARHLVAYIKSLWGKKALSCQGPKHMSC